MYVLYHILCRGFKNNLNFEGLFSAFQWFFSSGTYERNPASIAQSKVINFVWRQVHVCRQCIVHVCNFLWRKVHVCRQCIVHVCRRRS